MIHAFLNFYTCFQIVVERLDDDDETGSDIYTSDEDIWQSDVDYDSHSSISYNPEGISSDDGVDGCCHWSTTRNNNPDDDFNMTNTPETA